MKSWDINKNKNIKTPESVIKFLNEIDNICKKYNFSISHEDCHGSFILEKYKDYNIKWLKDCMLNLKEDQSMENEIKVGEYVRLKKGEIFKIDEDTTNYYNSNKEFITNDVSKHSFNLIDIIEERRLCKRKRSKQC